MRIAITGSSGQIASKLIPLIAELDECEVIWGIDLKPPEARFDKFHFLKKDVRDPLLKDFFKKNKIKTVFHLAFVLNPIHNTELMYEINIKGTENVLKCALEAGVEQVLITSSASAYGALPDNPVPLKEDHPLRAEPAFPYAYHKRLIDLFCQEFAEKHPEIKITIFRPVIVIGRKFENFIARVFLFPFNFFIAGSDPYLQFISEEDVARGIMLGFLKKKAGAFNLAGEGMLKLSQIWEIQKRFFTINFPEWVIYPLIKIGWRVHFPGVGFPEGAIDYFRYPWVVDISKAKAELGFTPSKTSREVWEEYVRFRKENPLTISRIWRKRMQEKRALSEAEKSSFS